MSVAAVDTESLDKPDKPNKPIFGGLAGFLMGVIQRGRAGFGVTRPEKRMRLVETLALGGKRQLMLVSCGEKKFLVGAGSDGIQTIVALDTDEVSR